VFFDSSRLRCFRCAAGHAYGQDTPPSVRRSLILNEASYTRTDDASFDSERVWRTNLNVRLLGRKGLGWKQRFLQLIARLTMYGWHLRKQQACRISRSHCIETKVHGRSAANSNVAPIPGSILIMRLWLRSLEIHTHARSARTFEP